MYRKYNKVTKRTKMVAGIARAVSFQSQLAKRLVLIPN